MGRYKIYVEYEGTRYEGWQKQKTARTVQGEIEKAIKKALESDEFEFQGAGRTDAGVHALEQVAHLEIKTGLSVESMRRRINDELPADIDILKIERSPRNFHARHDAIARSYIYQISRRRTAFGKKWVWWVKDDLNLKEMQKTTGIFTGMNDFASFVEIGSDDGKISTKVLIEEIRMKEAGNLILIRICASHFMWKLVRRLVGVIVEVGKKRLSLEEAGEFLTRKSPQIAQWTAPPSGLFLERVYYPGEKREQTLEPIMRI